MYKRAGKLKPAFGIENKTGRSSIKEMSQFQLDTSDCDTICNEMKRLKIPVVIIHAQVLENWHAPTVGFRIVGLWWSDVYQMAANFTKTAKRRDENRGAAFFRKKAFGTMDNVVALLAGKKRKTFLNKFKSKGVPKLYR